MVSKLEGLKQEDFTKEWKKQKVQRDQQKELLVAKGTKGMEDTKIRKNSIEWTIHQK
jgi:hypothetical protein